jgi:hypothetical protein
MKLNYELSFDEKRLFLSNFILNNILFDTTSCDKLCSLEKMRNMHDIFLCICSLYITFL